MDEIEIYDDEMLDPLFEEEIPQEELDYVAATELMNSVDCVTRFERKVIALTSAASKFQNLGDYKDSKKLGKECLEIAEKSKKEGIAEAYKVAVQMQKEASGKMDYRTVISEFERFPEYKDSAERIEQCKKKIIHIENIAVWKKRGILVAIVAVLAVVFVKSPALPFSKGIVHKKQGNYKLAIANFKEANGFINSENMIKSCRYQQALLAQEKGDKEKALRFARMAFGNKDADRMATEYEVEKLKKAYLGDNVTFGKRDWTVLSITGNKFTLLYNGDLNQREFDKEGSNDWLGSYIRRWLKNKYKPVIFNTSETKLLQKVNNDPKGKKLDRVYLLSKEEFTRYEDIIGAAGEWWLRDAGTGKGTACYVNDDNEVQENGKVTDKKGIRPAVQITLDTQAIQPTIEPTHNPDV